jgi:hypothetical protein
MEQAAYQLSCVGRNLNQLMRAIHSGKLPAAAELQTVLSALQIHLKQIGTELRGMVDRSYDRRVQETVLP